VNTEKGFRVVARVSRIKGTCKAGYNVGDEICISARNTAGMCGYLYHAAFPYILMLQFGGTFPWGDPDEVELECPDKENLLTIRLRRIGLRQTAGTSR
jgi:uncharacterized repeat protein (TIGR04076 family)